MTKIGPLKGMAIGVGAGLVLMTGVLVMGELGLFDVPPPSPAAAPAASAAQDDELPQPGTIPQGTWTVGKDIPPGTYRVATPIDPKAYCYWAIYRSGTNKQDVVQMDIPAGGRPSVTLEVGQDFTSNSCGTWVKE